MKLTFLALLCTGLSLTAIAQIDPFELVEYQNPLQEKYFKDLKRGDTNFMGLFVAAAPEADSAHLAMAREKLRQLYQLMKPEKLKGKRPKKQIKTVFETVHEQLLKQYKLENQFTEVFARGHYNCVSATAVYSYMLQRLEIPHVVVEEPTHVYAMAFPRGQDWVLESTSPAHQGYYRVKEKDRKKQLDLLVEQKIITEEQRNSDTLQNILDRLFPSQAIGHHHLLSLQYTNQSVYDFEDEKYWDSFQNGLKAYLIEPGPAQKALLHQGLGFWLDKHQLEHPLYFKALTYHLASDTSQEHIEAFLSVWDMFSRQYLAGQITQTHYDKLLHHYGLGLHDSAIINLVHTNYYNHKGLHLFNQRKYAKAYNNALLGLAITPDEEELLNLYLVSMVNQYRMEGWEAKQIHTKLMNGVKAYPKLKEIPNFEEFYPLVHGTYITSLLDNYHYRKAGEELNTLEQNIDSTWLMPATTKDLLAGIYVKMAIYAFNTSKSKARLYLKRGTQLLGRHEFLSQIKNKYLD